MGSGTVGKVRRASLSARGAAAVYIEEAESMLKDKTIFLQDGFVYIRATVQGQLVYAKAKVTEPIKSCAVSVYGSSRERLDPAIQKLRPYYVKVQNGYADIVVTVDTYIVVVKAKIHDSYTSMQTWTLQSLDGARTVLQGYASPLLSKAISVRQFAATKVDHIWVGIRDGVVYVNGVVGERSLRLQTKVSETAICKQMTKGWKATFEITGKLLGVVSDAYGNGRDALKVIQCSIKDRCLYITCQANDRLVVIRIKISEVGEHIWSRSKEVYVATRAGLSDVTWEAKRTILNATEITRTKAFEAGKNIRSFAANPDARAAAAGAVAGGTSAGVTGLLAGGAVGAACALPAAFFTFGLSIPVGAAIGAGSGLCVGGSAGMVAGGAAGYKAHREKESIGKSISGAFAQAKARKDKAVDSASDLRLRLSGRISGTAFA